MIESVSQSEAEVEPEPSLQESTPSESTPVDPQRLPLPEETQPMKILWDYVIVLALIHLAALYAFIPWFFTWSGLVLAIVSVYVFATLGINIGYHRLLTHRGFTCPKWLEHSLAILGICNLQDSPARWVAIHRMHHQHSDHQPDPHSPLASFLWAHIGWVVVRNRDLDRTTRYERYVRDLLRDPFYLRLERKGPWFFVFLSHAAIIIVAGAITGYFVSGGLISGAIQYAASWGVWAVAVRAVFVLHVTWSVNSLSHLFGYRNYETRDHSTNNWLVALLTNGEGWHNNHHAEPRAAAHGHRWWEFDVSWWTILAMEKLGLAKNVVRPKSMQAPS